jgi:hypothetical protein
MNKNQDPHSENLLAEFEGQDADFDAEADLDEDDPDEELLLEEEPELEPEGEILPSTLDRLKKHHQLATHQQQSLEDRLASQGICLIAEETDCHRSMMSNFLKQIQTNVDLFDLKFSVLTHNSNGGYAYKSGYNPNREAATVNWFTRGAIPNRPTSAGVCPPDKVYFGNVISIMETLCQENNRPTQGCQAKVMIMAAHCLGWADQSNFQNLRKEIDRLRASGVEQIVFLDTSEKHKNAKRLQGWAEDLGVHYYSIPSRFDGDLALAALAAMSGDYIKEQDPSVFKAKRFKTEMQALKASKDAEREANAHKMKPYGEPLFGGLF